MDGRPLRREAVDAVSEEPGPSGRKLLIEPSEPYDATYAHKPWVIKHNGVVYHFYCAVGNKGRGIALATSTKIR